MKPSLKRGSPRGYDAGSPGGGVFVQPGKRSGQNWNRSQHQPRRGVAVVGRRPDGKAGNQTRCMLPDDARGGGLRSNGLLRVGTILAERASPERRNRNGVSPVREIRVLHSGGEATDPAGMGRPPDPLWPAGRRTLAGTGPAHGLGRNDWVQSNCPASLMACGCSIRRPAEPGAARSICPAHRRTFDLSPIRKRRRQRWRTDWVNYLCLVSTPSIRWPPYPRSFPPGSREKAIPRFATSLPRSPGYRHDF